VSGRKRIKERFVEMAANSTKKAGTKSTGAKKNTTTAKKTTNAKGTRNSGTKQTGKTTKSAPKAKNAQVKGAVKEELVPELSNELVLLVTLVVSVLLFLSNFSLSCKVG
jgi:hypothetical protein